MRRARFTVAYDGTGFNGSAEQVGVPTVMGELRAAIERITQRPIEMHGAGRTDTGVHGWGQVISLDLPDGTDLAGLQRRINRLCSPGLAARDIEWTTDPEFHARFSAVYRHYRDHVLNSKEPNPFVARTAWHITEPSWNRRHAPGRSSWMAQPQSPPTSPTNATQRVDCPSCATVPKVSSPKSRTTGSDSRRIRVASAASS